MDFYEAKNYFSWLLFCLSSQIDDQGLLVVCFHHCLMNSYRLIKCISRNEFYHVSCQLEPIRIEEN